ncbi:MAG: hypothetical protein D6797_04765, partial [Bdellovibrio sp.]
VWGNGLKNGRVKDEVCALSPRFVWKAQFSESFFVRKLQRFFKIKQPIKSFFISKYSLSKRASLIQVEFWGMDKPVFITPQQLRRLFGFSKIKSAHFHITWKNNKVIFNGRGLGHGVGLCQWGSRFYASQGFSYLQILKHYFPKAILPHQKLPGLSIEPLAIAQ